MSEILTIDGRRLRLSNLEKPLYPSGFMKHQVIDYYVRIAPALLRHLTGRAVTLKRYPNGTDASFFYEKRCPPHRPDWMSTAGVMSRRNEGIVNHCLIEDVAGLVWAANLAALELHVPLAKAKQPERPTVMVFDLDPGPGRDLRDCAALALKMRDLLDQLELESFVKGSGGKGLHLYVPLNTPVDFNQTKSFARALGTILERQNPKEVTTVMKRSLREGKIFIDWSQNDRHKTTVCAYSLRAGPRPTVSAPLSWEELERYGLRRGRDALLPGPDEVVRRLEEKGELFEPVATMRQRLPKLKG